MDAAWNEEMTDIYTHWLLDDGWKIWEKAAASFLLNFSTSDDVASCLQVSDLYKSDLQVSSRFANDLM